MPTYPVMGQGIDSTEVLVDLAMSERGNSNVLRKRDFSTSDKRVFTITHIVNSTDRVTLYNFYTTNRLVSFDFTWVGNGVTYTCMFTAPPSFINVGGSFWQVTQYLAEI